MRAGEKKMREGIQHVTSGTPVNKHNPAGHEMDAMCPSLRQITVRLSASIRSGRPSTPKHNPDFHLHFHEPRRKHGGTKPTRSPIFPPLGVRQPQNRVREAEGERHPAVFIITQTEGDQRPALIDYRTVRRCRSGRYLSSSKWSARGLKRRCSYFRNLQQQKKTSSLTVIPVSGGCLPFSQ